MHKRNFDVTFQEISAHRSVLYGFAALWILFLHMEAALPGTVWLWPVAWFKSAGACGVEVFLLLTGFGLYRSLQRDPRIGAFYRRRFERVFLPAFVVVAVYYGLKDTGALRYLSQLTLFGYWIGRPVPWYAPFILTMYLIYPAIYRIQARHPRALWALLAASLGLSFIVAQEIVWVPQDCQRAFTRIPVFLAGCMLAPKLEKRARIPGWMLPASLAACAAAAFGFARIGLINYFSRSIVYFLLAIFMILLVTMVARGLTRFGAGRGVYRCLALCGQVSLEIYLLFGRLLPGIQAVCDGASAWKINLTAAIFTLLLAFPLRWFCELLVRQFRAVTVPEQR